MSFLLKTIYSLRGLASSQARHGGLCPGKLEGAGKAEGKQSCKREGISVFLDMDDFQALKQAIASLVFSQISSSPLVVAVNIALFTMWAKKCQSVYGCL